MTSSVLPLSAERPHLRNLSDDATGERADGNPATQIIGNASPLSLAPDDGPEVATLAPPGHLPAAFCSHSGNGASIFSDCLLHKGKHEEGGA